MKAKGSSGREEGARSPLGLGEQPCLVFERCLERPWHRAVPRVGAETPTMCGHRSRPASERGGQSSHTSPGPPWMRDGVLRLGEGHCAPCHPARGMGQLNRKSVSRAGDRTQRESHLSARVSGRSPAARLSAEERGAERRPECGPVKPHGRKRGFRPPLTPDCLCRPPVQSSVLPRPEVKMLTRVLGPPGAGVSSQGPGRLGRRAHDSVIVQ